jgi:hypothetical protein
MIWCKVVGCTWNADGTHCIKVDTELDENGKCVSREKIDY